MTTTRDSKARPDRVRRLLPFRRFARNSDGATAVEFGLLAIPFLMVLFAVLEAGISVAVQQSLVNATEDVARQIRTGQIKAVSQAQLEDLICERMSSLIAPGCPGLRVDLRRYDTFQQAASDTVAPEPDEEDDPEPLMSEIGGSGARQTLRAFYFWPVFTKLLQPSMARTADGRKLLAAYQTWQNEAY